MIKCISLSLNEYLLATPKSNYPYILPELIHHNYDLSKRWYIKYYIWHKQKQRKIRKREAESINLYNTVKERIKVANEKIAEITAILTAGYCISDSTISDQNVQTKSKKPSIQDLFSRIYEIRKGYIDKESWRKDRRVQEDFIKSLDEQKQIHPKKITKIDIINYLDTLSDKAPSTYNGKLTILRQYFTLLEERGFLKQNPCNGVKGRNRVQKKRNKSYTQEEVETLLKNAPSEYIRFYMLLMLYLFTRCNETRLIQLQHINLKNRTIYIPEEEDKTRIGAFVTIPDPLFTLLYPLRLNKYPPQYYLISKTGIIGEKPTGKNYMYSQFKKIQKQTGILFPKRSLYNLRHTGARLAYENGVKLTSLQKQLRHSTLSMTAVYLESLGIFENEDIRKNMPTYFSST